MKLIARLACAALLTTAAAAAMAQGAVSPAKKELVQKVLALQQPAIEGLGTMLATQTANQILQAAGQALAGVPADKREALGAELQAEARKFFEDIAPILRSGAVKSAPATIGATLEEKFSDEELKTLVVWLESPVSKKFQQLSNELQQGLGQKLVNDTRAQIDPKLKALETVMRAKLSAAGVQGAAASGNAKPAAPAKK
ncbi:MAG TPA: hypothetical protein PK306_29050 [Aquabacterium sp.]|nr:hypothetical protein [Aquabacterium sp.]HQC99763.1 hypothetical protein [Aquabacterium sp.]